MFRYLLTFRTVFGKKKRPKTFSLDCGNVNIPAIYRVAFLKMSEKEREKFLDAYWEDVQNRIEYTKE